jgi:hypothetical protein
MNLSALSTEDLLALKAGDLSKVSTAGLLALRGDSNTQEFNDRRSSAPDPVEQSFAQKTRAMLGPTVEALGAVGGGALGAPLGPLGIVGGSGLGYGIAKGGLRLLDQALGTEPPKTAAGAVASGAKDVLVGATMEAGGRVVAPYVAKGAGWVVDRLSGNFIPIKAAKIAREAIGPDAAILRYQLKNAPANQTAAQATADTNAPIWQALNERASIRDPRFYGAGPLTPAQTTNATEILNTIAGGQTQTGSRIAQDTARQALKKELIPVLKTELQAANTAGVLKPRFDAEAQRMSNAAASKVEDVRRFMAAQERAGGRAHTSTFDAAGKPVAAVTAVPGYPRQPGRYTYMGELEKKAGDVAGQAAQDSLPLGEAARFAQSTANSLEAHGLRPLTPELVMGGIRKTLANPEFAGNTDLEKIMLSVADEISRWTKNGTINAWALDSIRKNAANAAVRDLFKGNNPDVQAELAGKVATRLKPLFVDAIENAGGTGYGKYLRDWAKGEQAMSQTKFGAQAMDAFKTSPKSFVDLISGNKPKDVEKIFGYENFDIAKQMNPESMRGLLGISDLTRRGLEAGTQATTGRAALNELLERNISKLKIPWGLSPKTMAMNKALDVLERKVGTKTMNALAEALKSGKTADELLNALPATERNRILKLMSDPSLWAPGMSAATVGGLLNSPPEQGLLQ